EGMRARLRGGDGRICAAGLALFGAQFLSLGRRGTAYTSPEPMALVTALVAIVAGFLLYLAADRLAGSTAGRLAMLLGVLFLPLTAVTVGANQAYRESSSTTFCMSCHEMTDHGRSLFVDDRRVLPAVH